MLLSSCANSSQLSESKADRKKTHYHIAKKLHASADPEIDILRQQEAKLSDIPLPGFSQPIPEYYSGDDGLVLGYRTTLSADDLCSFYQTEMEREGWLASAKQFCGQISSLSFEKPDRVCRVSIVSQQKQTEIIIFTGQKDLESA